MSASTRTRRTWFWLGLILLAAAAATLYARRPSPALTLAPTEALLELGPNDLAVARAGDIARHLQLNGNLRPQAQAVVRAKVAGEIKELSLREGDRVEAGQVLAKIETADYASRLEEKIAALAAAKSQAQLAEATRRKNQELQAKGFLSPLANDNATAAAEVAVAQLHQQEAQLEVAKKALADTVVRSPMAGWVAERAVQRGDKTAVDGKLFTLVDLSRMEMEALLPASEIAQVAVGQPFSCRVEGYGERPFEGRVARIAPSTQAGNRYLPIYIELDNADAALRAGVFAEGSLQLARAKAQALIPITAVRNEAGVDFVYVIAGDRLRRQPVVLGMKSEAEGLVDVQKGLVAGTQVIAANLGNLKDGVRVHLAPGKP